MHTLVTAACAVHNLSLAKALGGPLFAKAGLRPALISEIKDEKERGRILASAWTNYNRINVPAHVLFTATWLVERRAVLGLQVDRRTQKLVAVKDFLIAGALVTGLANVAVGKMIVRDYPEGVPVTDEATTTTDAKLEKYRAYFRVMGPANLFFVGASLAIGSAIGGGVIRSLERRIFARLLAD
jgi:uncharacterized membrane protein